jgi:subtilisin family serine protease
VLSTAPGGYEDVCGTSIAAPHVTGVLALIAGANPDAGPDELREVLTSSARPLSCPRDYDRGGNDRQAAYCSGYRAYNGFYGHGLVDAAAALEAIAS